MLLLSPPRLLFCRSSTPATAGGRLADTGGAAGRGDAEGPRSPGVQRKRHQRGGEKITSTSNPFVKHCVKLRQSSSYRRSCAAALVVGLAPILEICRFKESKNDETSIVDCLLLLDGAACPEGLDDTYTSVVHVSPNVMKKLSGMQSVDSIEGIALMRIPRSFHDMDENQEEEIHWSCFPSPHRILVLDGIQDPGNLGTLLRSAMAFNWDGVFLLSGCCDPFNEKALRAARGASFQLPLVSGNWSYLNSLRTRFQMKMLAGHPGNCSEVELKGPSALSKEFADSLSGMPLCLVLGSEGNGLSMQTMKYCELVSIPMAGLLSDEERLRLSDDSGGYLDHMFTDKELEGPPGPGGGHLTGTTPTRDGA